jgi:hypothetical protein
MIEAVSRLLRLDVSSIANVSQQNQSLDRHGPNLIWIMMKRDRMSLHDMRVQLGPLVEKVWR